MDGSIERERDATADRIGDETLSKKDKARLGDIAEWERLVPLAIYLHTYIYVYIYVCIYI